MPLCARQEAKMELRKSNGTGHAEKDRVCEPSSPKMSITRPAKQGIGGYIYYMIVIMVYWHHISVILIIILIIIIIFMIIITTLNL
jgi:hypothetical protein